MHDVRGPETAGTGVALIVEHPSAPLNTTAVVNEVTVG